MRYYPVLLDIKDKNCLVVGAGPVGARKAHTLDRCGARVCVVGIVFSDRFNEDDMQAITCRKKEYEPDDLCGMSLVFAATDNPVINRKIKQDAVQKNILCNVADAPDSSSFILPSVIHRGDLILAVSTCGASPALAKTIRQNLEKEFGPEYEKMLQVMGSIRKRLLSRGHAPREHKKILYALIEAGMLELIKQGDEQKINFVLHDLVGTDYNYQELMSQRSNE